MTYPPQPEPFAEALGEAAHTAAMAYRLVMTISDAVRRATQKRITGREEELGEDAEKMAPGWSADQLRGHLGDDILAVLMQSADWPTMARQLVGLQQAGVDLGTFLPQMGRMTAGVHQAVTANAARIKAEGIDRWADLLKTTMPGGLVRDAILASPAWPDIAAAMARLDDSGIDVARILTDAHQAGVGVDQAVAAVTAAAAKIPAPAVAAAKTPAPAPSTSVAAAGKAPAPASAPAKAPAPGAASARGALAERMGSAHDPWGGPPAGRVPAPAPGPAPAPVAAPAPAAPPVRNAVDPWAPPASTDAKRSWGPLTEGLDVPRNLDLGDRATALHQLKVDPAVHSQMVSLVMDILPEREAGLLVGSRQWPLLAARMQNIRESDSTHTVARHLHRLTADTSWKQATGTALAGRLVDPSCPDHTADRAPRARVPAVGLADGRPLPFHHHPRRRGPRQVGPGRGRRPRPPTAGRAHQGRGTSTVTAPHRDPDGDKRRSRILEQPPDPRGCGVGRCPRWPDVGGIGFGSLGSAGCWLGCRPGTG
ncbi:hypothetical protein ABZY81_40915 [Streptomyces sp. NPDC006514]|uniref:hypothetical protein n=1 Tax=Streptomyces sp. NPDC006514 TaxID=3154308 RepID=UPI0033BF53E8